MTPMKNGADGRGAVGDQGRGREDLRRSGWRLAATESQRWWHCSESYGCRYCLHNGPSLDCALLAVYNLGTVRDPLPAGHGPIRGDGKILSSTCPTACRIRVEGGTNWLGAGVVSVLPSPSSSAFSLTVV